MKAHTMPVFAAGAICYVLTICIIGARAAAPSPQSPFSIEETKLVTLSDSLQEHQCIFNDSVEYVGYLQKAGNQWRVVLDNKPGKLFDDVQSIECRGNSRAPFYVARSGKNWFAVYGADTIGPCDSISVEKNYECPQNRAEAYMIRKNGVWQYSINGKVGAAFDSIAWTTYYGDGKTVLYKGFRKGKECIVVGDSCGPLFDGIVTVAVNKRAYDAYCYAALSGGKYIVVSNTKKSEESYDQIGYLGYGPHATEYYAARKDGKWFFVIGKKKTAAFDMIRFESLCFDDKGSSVAFIAHQGAKWFVVHDNVPGRGFEGVDQLSLSSDGKTVTYLVSDGGKDFFMHNARQGEVFDSIFEYSMWWSKDGTRCVYSAYKNKQRFVVLDTCKYGPYDRADDFIELSPDGRNAAYCAWVDKKLGVYVNGKLIEQADFAEAPMYLKDGTTLWYQVRQNGKHFVVVGEKRSQGYDAITGNGPVGSQNVRNCFFGRKGKELWRIIVRFKG
jgi:hypothetical protein